MSKFRMNAEWVFGDIINYFKFLDFKKCLKLRLSAIIEIQYLHGANGKMCFTCAILPNECTCLYSNKTSKYFGLIV